jgi:hypothetical protein
MESCAVDWSGDVSNASCLVWDVTFGEASVGCLGGIRFGEVSQSGIEGSEAVATAAAAVAIVLVSLTLRSSDTSGRIVAWYEEIPVSNSVF